LTIRVDDARTFGMNHEYAEPKGCPHDVYQCSFTAPIAQSRTAVRESDPLGSMFDSWK
jgi:hypothetical protein